MGLGYAIFDTGVGRCGIVWSDAGIVGVQLPEALTDGDDTRRKRWLRLPIVVRRRSRFVGGNLFDGRRILCHANAEQAKTG